MKRGVAWQSALGFALRLGGAGISYLFVFVLARTMDTESFGIVGTVLSASLLFAIVGCAGQRFGLLRFVAPAIAAPGAPAPEALIGKSFRIALLGNLLVWLLLLAILFVGHQTGYVEHALILAFGCTLMPLTGIIEMQAHLARSYRSLVLALAPKDILWRLITGLVVLGLYVWSGVEVSAMTVLSLLIAFLILMILAQSVTMSRVLKMPMAIRLSFRSYPDYDNPGWRKAIFPLWIASITAIVFTNLDVVTAGLLIGPQAAALYYAANRIAMVPLLINDSFVLVVGPSFSTHHVEQEPEELRSLAHRTTIMVFILTVGIVSILALLAEPILRMFGQEFVGAVPVLRILLLTAFFNAAFGLSDLLLAMCGQERPAMWTGLAGTAVGSAIVIGSALTGTAEAVAMGTVAAIVVARLFSLFAVYRCLGFSPDIISATLALILAKRAPNHV